MSWRGGGWEDKKAEEVEEWIINIGLFKKKAYGNLNKLLKYELK